MLTGHLELAQRRSATSALAALRGPGFEGDAAVADLRMPVERLQHSDTSLLRGKVDAAHQTRATA